jgi:hypothetical protein
LRDVITAAQQEFDLAITFHEVWKPSAYDAELRHRMGASYATNAFHVVRSALRREMLLALTRLWDKDHRNVGMYYVADALRDDDIFDFLVTERVQRLGIPEAELGMRQSLVQLRDHALPLIDSYAKGGTKFSVLEKIKTLRNKRLAHRQARKEGAASATATDDEIESFYNDNCELVRTLLSLVNAVAYDPSEAADVYRYYASSFWAPVCGERTEGHPKYRRSPQA